MAVKNSSYYTMAEMYRDIGQFNRDITLNVQEASDKEPIFHIGRI